jgi:exodeoxyribonuclease III
MFKIASWNLNSVRSRLTHVTIWLKAREPDVLLLQELKGTEFPSAVFQSLGYESVAVTQKTYNGVAILSRHPDVTGESCTKWNERESTWRKSGSCPSKGTSQSRS